MQDFLKCPICDGQFQNLRWENHYFWLIDKESNFMERKCHGKDHSILIFTDLKTKEIDYLKISSGTKTKSFVGLDLHNQRTTIGQWQNGRPKYFNLSVLLIPDFPELTKLKEDLSKYIKLA